MTPESWQSRVRWIVIGAVLGGIIALLLPWFVGKIGDAFGEDPEVRADLEDIEAEVAELGRFVASEERVSTSEGAFRLVVVRHQGVGPNRYALRARAPSDEVRIYNETGDGLSLEFRFQPKVLPPEPLPEVAEDVKQFPLPFVFEVQGTPDLNDDGEPEVVGAFYLPGMTDVRPRPVVFSRDRPDAPFTITGLAGFFTPPARQSVRGNYARGVQTDYRRRTLLRDVDADVSLLAPAVEAYAVVDRERDFPVLLLAYLLEADAHADLPTLALRAGYLLPREGGFDTYPCKKESRGLEYLPRESSDPLLGLNEELSAYWNEIASDVDADCEVPEYVLSG